MNTEKELKEKTEAYQRIILAQKHLEKVYRRIGEAYARLEAAEKELEREHRDISALEGFSINRLFREILGDKEEQLEIQRQEYLQRVLQFRELNNLIRLLEFERGILEEKVSQRPRLKAEIDRLVQLREREIMDRQNEREKEQIDRLNEELKKRSRVSREIYEAKRVGRAARRLTEEILQLLRSAVELRNWGSRRQQYDYSREQSYIDQSVDKYYQLKIRLQEFEDELRDVYKHRNVDLVSSLDQFQNFTRAYYDYLINDWIVKNRIYNTLAMLESLKDGITRILRSLDVEDVLVKSQIETIQERKKRIILGDSAEQ